MSTYPHRLTRLVIYPKDIQRITGKTDRYARRVLAKIRQFYQKQQWQLVSLHEYCSYTGLKSEEVQRYICD